MNIYQISLEIVEAGPCPGHKVGDRFEYPDDSGSVCPFLLDSATGMLRALMFGATLPWSYAGTPYAKQIDPEGVTTEFVRCPDSTGAGVVMKITRTKVGED